MTQAVELAWREDELNGKPYPQAGTLRGSPEYKDGYYYVAVTFIIRYGFDKYNLVAGLRGGTREKKVGCPSTSMSF